MRPPREVVTHNAGYPHSILLRYTEHPMLAGYASDLIRLMGKSTLWIDGHTHGTADLDVGGMHFVCNPRGYAHWTRRLENS